MAKMGPCWRLTRRVNKRQADEAKPRRGPGITIKRGDRGTSSGEASDGFGVGTGAKQFGMR